MVTKVHESDFTKTIVMVDFEDVKQKCPVTIDVCIIMICQLQDCIQYLHVTLSQSRWNHK